MKKLFGSLFLLAGLLLSAPAQATVACSVPFNLTNGTTADASQVMANYNAILSCLSTSAAVSGANNDITSLTALTTPITPAQGGAQALCGASGFFAKNNVTFPTTQVNITFTQAVVTTSLNAVQFGSNGSLTLNFATTGVNGLDTGAQTASTTYYVYLIGNGSVINSLASLSSTSPSLPGGYTYSCRVGSLRTNASTQLYSFFQQGRTVSITQSLSGDTAFTSTSTAGTCATTTFVTLSLPGIPATAGYATGYIFSVNLAGNGTVTVGRTVGGGQVASILNANPVELFIPFTVPLVTPSTVVWCNDTATVQGIFVNGWSDSVNVN